MRIPITAYICPRLIPRTMEDILEKLLTVSFPSILHLNLNGRIPDERYTIVHLFNELYEVAYTPAFYHLLGSNMQLHHSDEKVSNSKETNEKLIHEKIPPRNQRQKYITNIEQLTVSNLSSSSTEWSQFHQQIRAIGIEIEAILYEDIKEEAIIDMLSSHCTFKMSPSSSSSTL
ncbi:hypothetical protein Cni_G29412 [Canna indica]|uniref:Uncharacterized protein n=1 Tax=Canna indica TaxID=4628 RepID=A0AAQ3L4B3_9LILI|nr:hypothetical protein Cni_G29412 [Canna indica]